MLHLDVLGRQVPRSGKRNNIAQNGETAKRNKALELDPVSCSQLQGVDFLSGKVGITIGVYMRQPIHRICWPIASDVKRMRELNLCTDNLVRYEKNTALYEASPTGLPWGCASFCTRNSCRNNAAVH